MAISYDEYIKQSKKKKKKEEPKVVLGYSTKQNNVKTTPRGTTDTQTLIDKYIAEKKAKGDIAPVKTTVPKKKDERTWFQAGAFSDGYQVGDVTKTILGTGADIGLGITKGVLNMGEGIVDLGKYGVSGVAKLLGAKQYANKVKKSAQENSVDKFFSPLEKKIDKNSIIGEKGDTISEGLGYVGGMIATGGLGGAIGGAVGGTAKAIQVGATLATTGTTFSSAMGSGMSQAYQEGATDEEAVVYGVISGVAEAGTELIFGGLGKSINAIGLNTGLSSADDMLAKKISGLFKTQMAKNIASMGVKMTAEGTEEVISGVIQAVGQKLTYMSEEDIKKLIDDQELLEAFISGAVVSGIVQSPSVIKDTKAGKDYITGYTQTEQEAIDKLTNERIVEQEREGITLTRKEKANIEAQVKEDLQAGKIKATEIDDIAPIYEDSALTNEKRGGGQADIREEEIALQEDAPVREDITTQDLTAPELTPIGTTVEADETVLKSQNYVYQASETDSEYRRNLNEDATKYANNTTRTHEFVNTLANVSEASGLNIRLTNNTSPEMTQRKQAMINSYAKRNNVSVQEASERLKNIVIDGYNVNDQITINVNSPKALNRLVGHEITHSLEKTVVYKTKLQKIAIDYAKSKNDYKSRLDRLIDLYEGQNADINKELTADIIGDYLFTDQKFVDNLYKKDRNLFQRIYDEIKHLINMVTAGSKEARELEKLKHSFEKAMRENKEMSKESKKATVQETKDKSAVEVESNTQEKEDSVQKTEKTETSNVTESVEAETKTEDKAESKIEENAEEYSLSGVDNKGRKLTEEQIEFFKDSKARDENGNLITVYHTMTDYFLQFNEFDPRSNLNYRFGDQVVNFYTDSKDMSGSYANYEYEMADTKKLNSIEEVNQWLETQDARPVLEIDNLPEPTTDNEKKVYESLKEYNADKKYAVIPKDASRVIALFKDEKDLIRNVKAEVTAMNLYNFKKYQYEGYVNITNPYIVEADGYDWNQVSQEFSENIKERFESLTPEERESLIKLSSQGKLAIRPVLERVNANTDAENGFSYYGTKYSSEDVKNLASAYVKLKEGVGMTPTYDSIYSVAEQRFKQMWIESASVVNYTTNDIVKRVIEENKHGSNYDGVIIRDVVDYGTKEVENPEPNDLFITFNSNQFKAWDNTNPTEDSDIRYSLSESTTDSEGRKLSKEQIEYFKDSKVRDAEGRLKVVYHGTEVMAGLPEDAWFTVFDTERAGRNGSLFGAGFYFTDSKEKAQGYAHSKGKVYETYLNIKNPFKPLELDLGENIDTFYDIIEQEFKNQLPSDWGSLNEYQKGRATRYILEDNGYDGVFVGNTYVAFNSNQIKDVDNTNPTEDDDIRYSLSEVDNQGNELTLAVQKRFENSKARDENGQLKVLYHGSPSGEFTIFDKNKANPEGNWGAGFYLTDNEYDVEQNYADGGGDFENKIERYAHQLETESMLDGEDISYEEAIEKAREQLYKGYYRIDAYVNVENPAIVGETYLFSDYGENYNIEDFETEEEYYEAVDQLVADDIDNAIWEVQRTYDIKPYDEEKIRNVLWEGYANGGIEVEELRNKINDLDIEWYSEFDSYMVGSDIARIIIESQGYDGIIDNTVSKKFRGMHLDEGTTHYIVFKPNQIKNISNENPTDNPDINKSLSRTDDVAPVGENDIFGSDIAVQEQVKEAIAPLQEQIETLTKTISDLQENMAPVPKELVEEEGDRTLQQMTDEDAPLTDEGTFSFLDEEVKVKKKSEIINDIASDFNIKKTEARELYNKIESIPEVTIDDVYTELENYRKVKFKEQDDYVKSIQDYIRGTKLDISNIKKQIPDYGNVYRMSNMGKGLILGNSGQGVDTFYQELNELFPNEFPSDVVAEADQLELISQAMYKEKEFTYVDILDDDELQILAERIYTDIGNSERYKHTQSGLYFLNREVKKMAPPGEINTDISEEEYADSLTTLDASNTEQVEETVSLEEELNELDRQKGPSIKKNPFDEVLDKFLEGQRPGKTTATPKVEKTKYENFRDTTQRLFVNEMVESDNLAKESGNLNIKYTGDMLNNVAGEIEGEIYTAQTDNEGHQIGKSLSALFSEAKKTGLYDAFNDYLEQYSNIDRHAQGKGSVVPLADSQRLVRHYEKTYPEFKQWGKGVWQYGANIRNNLIDAGIINEEFAEVLGTMYPHYVPYMENREMTNYNPDLGEIKPKGVIKRAKGGADNLLPIEEALTKYTFASKKAVRQNQFYQEIVSTLDSKAEVGADVRSDALDLEDTLYRDETGNYLTAYFDGERLSVRISDDLYTGLRNDLKGQIKGLEEKFALITDPVQKLSEWRRNLLTSWNPMFIIKNPIMDVQDALFNSKYTKDFAKNYPKAFVELGQAKSETAKQFLTLYGSGNVMGEYSSDGSVKSNKFLRGIERANNIMELAPRYAEFKASLENGASLQEAMYNAREVTTNFGRGGVITKALNKNGFTFLNVSVQGFDKFIRNFSGENGAKGVTGALLKATLLGVIPAVFNELAFGGDDEEKDEDYDALPDYIKDNYYLIKTGDGQFIRIPKGRILSVFGSAGRRTIEYLQGEEDAFEGYLKNANSQIGISNPLDSNILTPLFQAFGSENGEAWYGGDIVPTRLQSKAPREQYDASTDKFSIWLGDKIGVSPYKINYVIDQYSGGMGDIFLPFITEESTSDAEGIELALAPIKDQFTANSTFDNKYAGDIYDLSDKMDKMPSSVKETDEYKIQDAYLYSVTSEMGKLYAERRTVQENKELSKKEKYEKVQEIQKQINALAKEGLDNYEDVNSTSNYAIVGGREFNKYKSESGETRWGAVREDELEALNSYGLDIMEKSSYFNAKTYISQAQEKYKDTEDYTQKKRDIIAVIKSTLLTDEAKAYLYDKYYADSETLNTITSLGIDFDKYLDLEYQNFEADKNSAGKSISGSKKAKVFRYINSMDLSFEEKLVLTKLQYNSYNEHNGTVINYINSADLTYEQRVNILKKLGFKVDDYGNIKW